MCRREPSRAHLAFATDRIADFPVRMFALILTLNLRMFALSLTPNFRMFALLLTPNFSWVCHRPNAKETVSTVSRQRFQHNHPLSMDIPVRMFALLLTPNFRM